METNRCSLLRLREVIAETQTANLASCRLLEQAGMTVERTVIRYGAEQAIYGMDKQTYRLQMLQ